MKSVHSQKSAGNSFDVVIIGGGVIGSSVAYWLSLDPALRGRIAVVEKDNSYQFASTALSAASIRTQFSNPINVAISRFGCEFIRNFAEQFDGMDQNFDLGLCENGYLFLASTDQQVEIMRENHEIQRKEGADVCLLDPGQLQQRYPFLNIADVSLASIGERGEGWFDNMGLLNGLKLLAKQNDVKYLRGTVHSISWSGHSVRSVGLASGEHLSAGAFVNAAGPRAAEIAGMAHITLPVEPRKRTTFVLQTASEPIRNAPLIVDHAGVYLKPEGDYWLAATHPDPDPCVACDDFEPRHWEFEEKIWPKAAYRSEIFEAVKLRRMWAGHYAFNVLDQNAVLGLHPSLDNFYFANGFSGHGLQQAPAVGRGIAELILDGRYSSLDLSPLGFDRIIRNAPFLERNIV